MTYGEVFLADVAAAKNTNAVTDLHNQLYHRRHWRDKDFAFVLSAKLAMKERPEAAMPVILAELQQHLDTPTWHPKKWSSLSEQERKAVLRSKVFMKDKYLASGAFDRYKARLVAGGHQQDKSLYDDLSSPTIATSHILTIAALAAKEGRKVRCIDIAGAYLKSSMKDADVKVHMIIEAEMVKLLCQLDPSYRDFLMRNGEVVVELDRALYGLCEAGIMWYKNIRSALESIGYRRNNYDPCVFNKIDDSGTKRVRCITHSPPYVMCRALLIACVLYCVSRMNFVTTRNSTDNISPCEKFYNKKVDHKKHLSLSFGSYCQVNNPLADNTLAERTHGP